MPDLLSNAVTPCDSPLLTNAPSGDDQLLFSIGDYFRARGIPSPFLDELGRISNSPTYLVRTVLSPANPQAAAITLDGMTAIVMPPPDGTFRGILSGQIHRPDYSC